MDRRWNIYLNIYSKAVSKHDHLSLPLEYEPFALWVNKHLVSLYTAPSFYCAQYCLLLLKLRIQEGTLGRRVRLRISNSQATNCSVYGMEVIILAVKMSILYHCPRPRKKEFDIVLEHIFQKKTLTRDVCSHGSQVFKYM